MSVVLLVYRDFSALTAVALSSSATEVKTALFDLGIVGYFSLGYMQKIVSAVKTKHPHIPITLFSKNGGKHLTEIANTGCDGVGIDWTIDLSVAEQAIGGKVAIQGNLDPAVMYSTPDVIRDEVRKVLSQFKGDTGHIFNLGHGITPDVDPENMTVLVDSVHEFTTK